MLREFEKFAEKVEAEVQRSRTAWFARDKTNSLEDFTLILQTQVGQLSECVLGKGSRETEQEVIHVAAMAYEVYRKAWER